MLGVITNAWIVCLMYAVSNYELWLSSLLFVHVTVSTVRALITGH